MNKIYKVVWSKVKNCYVVASELAKSHTKSPKSGIMSRSLVASVLACVLSCGAVMPVYAGYTAAGGSNSGNRSIAIGDGSKAPGRHTNSSTTSSDGDAIAIGHDAYAYAENSIAIGDRASTYNKNTDDYIGGAIAIGIKSTSSDIYTIAIGDSATASNGSSIAIGLSSFASGLYSTAIGKNAYALASSNVALGDSAVAVGLQSSAIGSNTFVNENAEQSAAIGNFSVANDSNVVSFGHKIGDIKAYTYDDDEVELYDENLYRRLVNVADGVDDSDVATWGQVKNETRLSANGNYV